MSWPDMSPRYDRMFEENVPPSGNADTRFGEVLRNASRLIKRYYNDGDMARTLYGAEAVDDELHYLRNCGVDGIVSIADRIDSMMEPYTDCVTEDQYDGAWDEAPGIVPKRIEDRYDALLNELAAEMEAMCLRKEKDPYYLGPPLKGKGPAGKRAPAKKVGQPVPNRARRSASKNVKKTASKRRG